MGRLTAMALSAVFMALLFLQPLAMGLEKGGQEAGKGEKPGIVMIEAVTASSTVSAIDREKRSVTLLLEDGTTRDFTLGDDIVNFDRIEVGDKLKVTYAQAVSLFVRKPGDQPSAMEQRSVKVAPKGEKPAVIITDTSETAATVEAMDLRKRSITIRRLHGGLKTFSVGKDVEGMENIKVGDEVVIRVTDAVALFVEKPVP